MHRRTTDFLLVIVWLCVCSPSIRAFATPSISVFPSCLSEANITSNCAWHTRTAAPVETVIRGQWYSENGGLPVIMVLGQDSGHQPVSTPVSGFTLILRRLVLANVTLAKPGATGGLPTMWPLQLFEAAAVSFKMADVRLMVSDDDFQAYLAFFTADHAASTAVYHTDKHSFLHIASWTSSNTQLQSVTLIAGPCRPNDLQAYIHTQVAVAPAPADAVGSCAVTSVNAATLVPTLHQSASVATDQPLLVLIIGNVSLGAGLAPGGLFFRRPVLFVGLATRPTSVDFGMVVNQLNVTDAHAKIFWLSLVLENVAPGDAQSAILAPPYSTAISQNIWAMYCNRSHNCLNLYNTTTVVATETELDYLAFMYSAFNSPMPSMQQITDFYHTDIMVEYVKFTPGPGDRAITILRMKSLAWVLEQNIISADPVVARKLPLPAGLAVKLTTARAGPLVQTVDSCERLQAAMRYPKDHTINKGRQNVWMMLGDITIDAAPESTCWQDRQLLFPTQLYGQQLHGNITSGGDAHRMAEQALYLGSETARPGESQSTTLEGNTAAYPMPLDDKYALGFQYVCSALQLPDGADDQFLQIQNVTLLQLPQGPDAAAAPRLGAGEDGPTPPDVWTILLWSIGRRAYNKPLHLVNVQLMIPHLEFDLLSSKAKTARTFTLPLTVGASILITGAVAGDKALHFKTLQGPGLTAEDIWVVRDPDAASAMPDYNWPWSSQSPATRREKHYAAAIGASIGGGLLLALTAVGGWWTCRRRRQQKTWQAGKDQLPVFVMPSDSDASRRPSSFDLEAGKNGEEGSGSPLFVDASSDEEALSRGKKPLPVSGLCAAFPGSARVHETHLDSTCKGAMAAVKDASNCIDSGAEAKEAAPEPQASAPGDSISSGLQRWRAAFNSTTLHIMERRMSNLSISSARTPHSVCSSALSQPPTPAALGAARPSRRLSTLANQSPAPAVGANLQLQQLLGQGSFGGVYLGSWHGKRVAVKVMQLPASALLGPDSDACRTVRGRHQQKEQAQQEDSVHHMAIMETVVSSTMSHPNVVQVYTYTLHPLTVHDEAAAFAVGACRQGDAACRREVEGSCKVSGWELRLVMEYCEQGALREALSRGTLQGEAASSLSPAPFIVLSLAHDVAAAMLHLHSEGIVHGDLKAANVLLTRGGDDPSNVWAATIGQRLTAKVADFGMALPLNPNDTHATMTARGTPTHMSPELFMSGHVSKASDVYAYGILLYEIITGQRAYAGVPIPLLPHEVARQGLRPTWPTNLSASFRDLQRLAEACWAQQPQDRPTFVEIFDYLESCERGTPATELLDRSHDSTQPSPSAQHPQQQSPRQCTAAALVDWQLQDLRHTAEQQLQVVQQSPRAQAARPLPVALAVVNLGEIVWSGMSYTDVGAANTQLRGMF